MNILWLTPINSRSAIAKFSKFVTDELLIRGYGVTVCSIESEFDFNNSIDFMAQPIVSFSELSLSDKQYDVIIVNFGDHYPYHALCMDALESDRLIGIFHDADMTNFGNGFRLADANRDNRTLSPDKKITEVLAQFCDGAIAHSSFYEPVLGLCNGPISVIPLAWELPKDTVRDQAFNCAPAVERSYFSLLTFGNINSNKCADRVISAIGMSSNLKQNVHYRLVGSIDCLIREGLELLAQDLGVKLTVVGAVEDADLHREILAADCISCLRDPILEGASASAIEAMLHGRAVMVSDKGFYSGLPDDTVLKISPNTTPSNIMVSLEYLLENSPERAALGNRARIYARSTFAPRSYVDSLLKMIEDVRVLSAYSGVIKSIALKLTGLGLKADSAGADIVLQALEDMAPVTRRCRQKSLF